ncbi:hypothetical protein AB0K12_32895 [Nonomuraea sp. NPDC049419]|uniref:hypothetical protein n=1 Tax=Nonomuraea sp. NPDC049419 TaxID=3155772 RepID=UPI003433F599
MTHFQGRSCARAMCGNEEASDDLSSISTWADAIAQLKAIRATKPRQSLRELHDKMVRGNQKDKLPAASVVSRATLQRIFAAERQPKTCHLIGILYALDVPREQWAAWRDLVKRLETARRDDQDGDATSLRAEVEILKGRLEALREEFRGLRDTCESQLREAKEAKEAMHRATPGALAATTFGLPTAQKKLRHGHHDFVDSSFAKSRVRPYVSDMARGETRSRVTEPAAADEGEEASSG